MSVKPVLQPGPDHPITIEAAGTHVTATFGGRVIAETDGALLLREANYPAVPYLPLDSVDPDVLEATDHTTYCPYKGDASYFSLRAGETTAENVVWSYVAPYAPVAEIAGYVAFYPEVDVRLA